MNFWTFLDRNGFDVFIVLVFVVLGLAYAGCRVAEKALDARCPPTQVGRPAAPDGGAP